MKNLNLGSLFCSAEARVFARPPAPIGGAAAASAGKLLAKGEDHVAFALELLAARAGRSAAAQVSGRRGVDRFGPSCRGFLK